MSNEPAKVEFKCSECGARLRAAASKVGKKIRCAYCREVVTIPASAAGIMASGGTTRTVPGASGKPTTKKAVGASGVVSSSAVSPPSSPANQTAAPQTAAPRPPSGGTTRTDSSQVKRQPVSASKAAALVTGTTKVELASHSAEAGQVDAAGVIAADSRRIQSRVHLIDRGGESSRHEAATDLTTAEFMSVHDGPPVALTPRWAATFRQSVGPDWRVWVPLALIVGVIASRAGGDLAAVYALLGTAAGLLPPLLWLITVRVLWRRPSVVIARIASVVPLGPLRLVSLRWSAADGDAESDHRQRLIMGGVRGTNFAHADGRLMIALPSGRGSRPLLVVPHHLAARLRDGAPAPDPGERYELTACPKCAGSGRARLSTLSARWICAVLRLALVLNLAASAWFGMVYLGAGAAILIAASAVGVLFWVADLWPLIGCDQCVARGQLRRAIRPSPLADLLIWGAVCWLLMAPLGWRFHEATADLPRIHEVIDEIAARSGITPAVGSDALDFEKLTDAADFAAKLQRLWDTTARPASAEPDYPHPRPTRLLTAVAEYDQAMRHWVAMLIDLRSWERDNLRRALIEDDARKMLDHKRAAWDAACERLRNARANVTAVEHLGTAAPAQWIPRGGDSASFDRTVQGLADHAVAFFEPLRLWLQPPADTLPEWAR